jgi:hypothetical protein
MIRTLLPVIAIFPRQAQLQLDCLNSEYSTLRSSSEIAKAIYKVENARQELLSLIDLIQLLPG